MCLKHSQSGIRGLVLSSNKTPINTTQKNTCVLNGYLLKSWQLGVGGGEGEKCKPSMPPCYISLVKPLP